MLRIWLSAALAAAVLSATASASIAQVSDEAPQGVVFMDQTAAVPIVIVGRCPMTNVAAVIMKAIHVIDAVIEAAMDVSTANVMPIADG